MTLIWLVLEDGLHSRVEEADIANEVDVVESLAHPPCEFFRLGTTVDCCSSMRKIESM